MLLGGDEIGRTQRGNNNAYAQDNEVSWFDWDLSRSQRQLFAFTRGLIGLFRQHPVLRRSQFFQGRQIRGSRVKDLTWFSPDGSEMTDDEWGTAGVRTVGLQLAGDAIDETDERNRPVIDDTFLLLLNAADAPVSFVLPNHGSARRWEVMLDTVQPTFGGAHGEHAGGATIEVADRAVILLRRLPRPRRLGTG
jgi:glycogen operon protein